MKRISQREARRLLKRLQAFEQAERNYRGWSGDYWPGGVEVSRVDCETCPTVPMAVRTARKLGHAVVTVCDSGDTLRFVALPLPKVTA